jgi:hypothetical protein
VALARYFAPSYFAANYFTFGHAWTASPGYCYFGKRYYAPTYFGIRYFPSANVEGLHLQEAADSADIEGVPTVAAAIDQVEAADSVAGTGYTTILAYFGEPDSVAALPIREFADTAVITAKPSIGFVVLEASDGAAIVAEVQQTGGILPLIEQPDGVAIDVQMGRTVTLDLNEASDGTSITTWQELSLAVDAQEAGDGCAVKVRAQLWSFVQRAPSVWTRQ